MWIASQRSFSFRDRGGADARALGGPLRSLGEGMLVLADRNFCSFELWNEAAATGAHLLWRTKARHVLPAHERLPDGSYLSRLRKFVNYKMRRTDVVVRVIDYALDDPGRPQAEPRYRLITTGRKPSSCCGRKSPPRVSGTHRPS